MSDREYRPGDRVRCIRDGSRFHATVVQPLASDPFPAGFVNVEAAGARAFLRADAVEPYFRVDDVVRVRPFSLPLRITSLGDVGGTEVAGLTCDDPDATSDLTYAACDRLEWVRAAEGGGL